MLHTSIMVDFVLDSSMVDFLLDFAIVPQNALVQMRGEQYTAGDDG